MKSKLHWLLFDPESPLTDHSLAFGCRVAVQSSTWLGGGIIVGYHYKDYGRVRGFRVINGSSPHKIWHEDIKRILGHPIHLHHVLEALRVQYAKREMPEDMMAKQGLLNEYDGKLFEIMDKWERAYDSFTKSAQDIFFGDGVEWEEPTCAHKAQFGVYCGDCEERQTPKDPHVKALGELLIELFYTTLK